MPKIALLSICVIWGSTFFSQQIGVRAIGDNPLAACLFLFLRFASATVVMAVLVPKVFRALDRQTVRDGALLSLPFTIAFLSQVTGLRTTSPTISAFLTNMSVVFTPLLGIAFFKEKVSRGLVVGVVLSVIGVGIMTDPTSGRFGFGEALTLVCAVAFSLQIQWTNIFTKRSSPLGITFVLFVCCSLMLLVTMIVTSHGRRLLAELPVHVANVDVLWTSLYTSVVASVIGILLLNTYQKMVSPTRAAIIYMTEPIFAAIFALIFVAEPMTWPKVIGGAVIIGGNLLCELIRAREAEKEPVTPGPEST